jgi:Tfp pilus assembly protein PilX
LWAGCGLAYDLGLMDERSSSSRLSWIVWAVLGVVLLTLAAAGLVVVVVAPLWMTRERAEVVRRDEVLARQQAEAARRELEERTEAARRATDEAEAARREAAERMRRQAEEARGAEP